MENLKGFTATNNPNYQYKNLGNEYVIAAERWGKSKRINLIAVHKDETIERDGNPYYVPRDCNHTVRITNPIDGIVVNPRYLRLEEGTSFAPRLLNAMAWVLENRLK